MSEIRIKILRDWSWDREVLVMIKDAPGTDGRIVPHLARIAWEPKQQGFYLDPSDGALSGAYGELAALFKSALREIGDLDADVKGRLAATETHLQDMRALVFKTGKP